MGSGLEEAERQQRWQGIECGKDAKSSTKEDGKRMVRVAQQGGGGIATMLCDHR